MADAQAVEALGRLLDVMHALRKGCPWDAEQTHESLLHYLIEESCELVDAVEIGTPVDEREELGDLLLQVVFHAEIGAEEGEYTIAEIADGIADKLMSRHPYVFSDVAIPDDLHQSWEQKKRAEKGRTSSLDGIPERLSALARAQKVISRARAHEVPVDLATQPVTAEELGAQLLELTARAQASGVDVEQAARVALRGLEREITQAERRLS